MSYLSSNKNNYINYFFVKNYFCVEKSLYMFFSKIFKLLSDLMKHHKQREYAQKG